MSSSEWMKHAVVVNDQPQIDPASDWRSQAIPAELDNEALVSQYLELQKKYGSTSDQVKAFLAAAARGATFGLSDQALVKSGAVNPETLQGLKEANPTSSLIGEGVGVIGSIAAAPEAAIAKGASKIAGGTKIATELGAASGATKVASEAAAPSVGGLLQTAKEFSPATLSQRAGEAVTEALTPAGIASKGLASKALSNTVAGGLGSAVEGAAYGLGQAISEDALGNPDALGEELMSSVGFGAMLGGTIGATLGLGKTFIGKPSKEIAISELTGERPKTFQDQIKDGIFSEKEKQGIIEGLSRQKENAAEIKNAAKELGVDFFPGQISDSDAVHKTWSMLSQSPTAFGVQEQQAVQNAFKRVSQEVETVVAPTTGSPMSLAELGDSLKSSLTARFEQEYAPTKALYDSLRDYQQAIPVTRRSTGSIARNINKIIEENGLIKDTPAFNFVKNAAASLGQIDNLQKLQNLRSNLYKQAPIEAKWVAGAIKEKLDNLEVNAIKRFADEMKTPEAKSAITDLLEKSTQAKAGYKKLYDKMSEFGDVIGKRKINGPQDFMDFLSEGNTSERFAEKLFQKKNSAFTSFFKENFPSEWKAVSDYQKSKIINSAMKDGQLNIGSVIKQIDKLEPEMQRALFSKEQLKKIQAAKTWLEAFPKKFNPSETATGLGWMEFLESPVRAAYQTARDYGIKTGFKKLGLTEQEAAQIQTLARIERSSNNIRREISSGVRAFFATGAAKRSILPSVESTQFSENTKEPGVKEVMDKVKEYDSNPSQLLEKLRESSEWVNIYAPKTGQGLQISMVRATTFLASKVPGPKIQKPLAPKYEFSPAEIAKFNRYYETVKDPVKVLRKMKMGMLLPEHIETLQNVYPELFKAMQVEVTGKLSELMGEDKAYKMDYSKKMMLSMFLGQNLDPSLEPQNIALNQSVISGAISSRKSMENEVKPTQSGMKNLSMSKRSQTNTQELERREVANG